MRLDQQGQLQDGVLKTQEAEDHGGFAWYHRASCLLLKGTTTAKVIAVKMVQKAIAAAEVIAVKVDFAFNTAIAKKNKGRSSSATIDTQRQGQGMTMVNNMFKPKQCHSNLAKVAKQLQNTRSDRLTYPLYSY